MSGGFSGLAAFAIAGCLEPYLPDDARVSAAAYVAVLTAVEINAILDGGAPPSLDTIRTLAALRGAA